MCASHSFPVLRNRTRNPPGRDSRQRGHPGNSPVSRLSENPKQRRLPRCFGVTRAPDTTDRSTNWCTCLEPTNYVKQRLTNAPGIAGGAARTSHSLELHIDTDSGRWGLVGSPRCSSIPRTETPSVTNAMIRLSEPRWGQASGGFEPAHLAAIDQDDPFPCIAITEQIQPGPEDAPTQFQHSLPYPRSPHRAPFALLGTRSAQIP